MRRKKIKDLELRISDLRLRIDSLEKQSHIIGEFYTCLNRGQFSQDPYRPLIRNKNLVYQWRKFTALDINDQVEDKIKIQGVWMPEANVVFYDSIYYDKKKAVMDKIK